MKNLRTPVSIMFGRVGLKFEIWKNPISAAEVCWRGPAFSATAVQHWPRLCHLSLSLTPAVHGLRRSWHDKQSEPLLPCGSLLLLVVSE
jgi:hypothetical protein